MTLPLPDPVLDLDACALAGATRRGDLTPSEIVRTYLARLEAVNPELRAVITINPHAQAAADALDAVPQKERGVLHGVPLLVKDNIDVAGLPTTAGSVLLGDHVPDRDAPLVARLRAAGAVILGKANMTEWANFMTLGMPNGYSSLGGQTVNPWGPELDTGGSSSGSGVAVAARLCAAAIGTETSGSIVSPAHQNGVIGVKPTVGLIPRTGIIPISHSQDTAGPLTRSVRDAALLMTVMAGPDADDEASRRLPVPDLSLSREALKGVDLAAVTGAVDPEAGDAEGVSRDESAALARALATLRQAGAEVDETEFPTHAELQAAGDWPLEVLTYEFKPGVNAYLAGVKQGPGSLAEVIATNQADPATCLRYGQTLLLAAEATRGDLSETSYREARERDVRLTRTRGLDELFARGHDAVLFPGIHGYALAAAAGYPSVALPVPLQGGPHGATRPGGVLLVGPAGSDGRLLSLAAALNRELGGVKFPPERMPG